MVGVVSSRLKKETGIGIISSAEFRGPASAVIHAVGALISDNGADTRRGTCDPGQLTTPSRLHLSLLTNPCPPPRGTFLPAPGGGATSQSKTK